MGSLGGGKDPVAPDPVYVSDKELAARRLAMVQRQLASQGDVGVSIDMATKAGLLTPGQAAEITATAAPTPVAIPDPLEAFTKAVRGKLTVAKGKRSIASLFGGG